MIFIETKLAGAFLIEVETHRDDRGFFARTFCRREFEAHGLDPLVAQGNVSFNNRRGTVRGLHFQFPPAAEAKLIRCTRGAIVDVIVDLRPESPTYLQHEMVELTADNRRGFYVPERFAHGYQVLEDNTETTYLVSEFYTAPAESGLPFDDPRFGIVLPLPVGDISDKDRAWRPFSEREAELRTRLAAQPVSVGAP